MPDRNFHLRLTCDYNTSDNRITNLAVEVYSSHKWESFAPDVQTPGFLLFVYALFSCQLRYMRMNSAERSIVLKSTTGELQLVAGKNWNIKSVFVTFKSKLENGQPTEDDISYIRERMTHCPVSINLTDDIDMKNEISFN